MVVPFEKLHFPVFPYHLVKSINTENDRFTPIAGFILSTLEKNGGTPYRTVRLTN